MWSQADVEGRGGERGEECMVESSTLKDIQI